MAVHGANSNKDSNVKPLGSERFRTTKLINEEVLVKIGNKTEIKKEETIVGAKRLGFYVLPFIGFQSSQELEWKSVGGNFEIEEKNGVSWGLRVGHDWKYAFTDFQLSGFNNSFEEMDIGFPGVDFSGKSSGFGGMISGGLRYDFTRFFSASLGGGFGYVQQELSMSIMGIPVEDEDFIFTYHFFTGLELRPFEHFLIGLRYRWSRVGEMEYFSSRQIHFAELSAGYVF